MGGSVKRRCRLALRRIILSILPLVIISASPLFLHEAEGTQATLIMAIGNIRHQVSGGLNYYYFDAYIFETGGLGATLTTWQLCNQATGWCSQSAVYHRIEGSGRLSLVNGYLGTSASQGTAVVTYFGKDDNGNSVTVSQSFDYPESSSSTSTVEGYVTRLYQVVLQREPDPPGHAHNVNLCYEFGEVKSVTSGFFLSPEFLGGIGADAEAFVTALYRVALDRDPDAPGLAHNIGLITSHQQTRADLVNGFLSTPEFAAKDPFLFISGSTTPTDLTPAGDLTGTWSGSGTFSDNSPNPSCTWGPRLVPPMITMQLRQSGTTVTGTVTLDFPVGTSNVTGAYDSWECPALQGSSSLINGRVEGSRFTFTDSTGNYWNLSFTSDTLGYPSGTVSNSVSGVGIKGWNISLTRQ